MYDIYNFINDDFLYLYLVLDFKYYVFIIYNKEDEGWVKRKFLKFLEEEYGLRVCIYYKDFIFGIFFIESMVESVFCSYKIIVVYLSNFL